VAGGPRLVVPAYFHPSVRPADWDWLASRPDLVRFAILNVDSGPGAAAQPEFAAAAGRLAAAGVRLLGYVDTAYGRRDPRHVAADIGRYLDWYPVTGVCLDRAAAEPARAAHYALLAEQARGLGAEFVFFNHGTHPAEEYAAHADLLGTFEGPWSAYQRLRPPAWTRRWPDPIFYHVVHSVPPGEVAAAWRLIARHHVGAAYVTERGGPNPYDALPARIPGDAPSPPGPRGGPGPQGPQGSPPGPPGPRGEATA
jgi:hypothetical protein